MITKALLVTLPTSDESDPQPALNIKSNPDGTILLDVLVDIKRFPVSLKDMQEALSSIADFNSKNTSDTDILQISQVEYIPELEVMSLDNIPERSIAKKGRSKKASNNP